MRAPHRAAHTDEVALGDDVLEMHVQVRQDLLRAGDALAEVFPAVRAIEQRLAVVDEVRRP